MAKTEALAVEGHRKLNRISKAYVSTESCLGLGSSCKRKAQLANWIRVKAFCAAINVLLAMLIGLAACRVLGQLVAGQTGRAWCRVKCETAVASILAACLSAAFTLCGNCITRAKHRKNI